MRHELPHDFPRLAGHAVGETLVLLVAVRLGNLFYDLRQPEVHELKVSIHADHAVLRLDVAVQDAEAVHVVDGEHELLEPVLQRQVRRLVRADGLVERAALDELEHEEDLALALEAVEELHDVGVHGLAQDAELAEHPVADVARELLLDDLDREVVARLLVLREVHAAVAAPAEHLDDVVALDGVVEVLIERDQARVVLEELQLVGTREDDLVLDGVGRHGVGAQVHALRGLEVLADGLGDDDAVVGDARHVHGVRHGAPEDVEAVLAPADDAGEYGAAVQARLDGEADVLPLVQLGDAAEEHVRELQRALAAVEQQVLLEVHVVRHLVRPVQQLVMQRVLVELGDILAVAHRRVREDDEAVDAEDAHEHAAAEERLVRHHFRELRDHRPHLLRVHHVDGRL
mmetsp:Transcript_26946/g.84541  ORF Transcript_26946/g.84541 Transcript_26946/m.84541 type:complete len:402 (+) Transcript_26946:446-1651(+)